MRWLLLGIRLVLGGVFLYAGLVKSFSSARFALALVPFTFIPASWLPFLSLALPALEILGGILILVPPTRRPGALLLLFLALAFAGVLGWALSQGIIVSCSCFGQDETPSAAKMAWAMGRDLLLALGAAAVLGERLLIRRRPGSGRKTPASA